MATTKFKLRTSTISGNPGTLFVQVIHQRVARQVSTKYKLYPNEWDTAKQSVVITTDTPPDRSQYLHALHKALQHDTTRLQLIPLTLDIAIMDGERQAGIGGNLTVPHLIPRHFLSSFNGLVQAVDLLLVILVDQKTEGVFRLIAAKSPGFKDVHIAANTGQHNIGALIVLVAHNNLLGHVIVFFHNYRPFRSCIC